jgi:HEAT repeat protein
MAKVATPGAGARISRPPVLVCLVAGVLCVVGTGVVLVVLRLTDNAPAAAPLAQDATGPAKTKAKAPTVPAKGQAPAVPKAVNQPSNHPEPILQVLPGKARRPVTVGPGELADPPLEKTQPPDSADLAVKPRDGQARRTGPTDSQVARLLKQLYSAVKTERVAAMKALGNRGTAGKDAVLILIDRLCRYPADEADLAARVLAQIGAPSVPELVKALDDPSPAVRKRALWALGVIGPDAREAIQAISDILTDKDATLRSLAAIVLGEMGPQGRPAIPQLVKALRDADPLVRAWAAMALHDIGPETLGYLLALVNDGDLGVRLSAVQALPAFHESSEVAQALLGALKDPSRQVRAAAAAGLVQLGPDAQIALPDLVENLKENDLELQTQALTAILAIGSPRDAQFLDVLAGVNDQGWWAYPALDKKAQAARKELVKAMMRSLDDPNPMRRLAAVLALGQLGPEAKEAAGRLRKTLQDDPNRAVLAAALLVLPALDARQTTDGKTAARLIDEIGKNLKSTKKIDTEELLQLYILTSTITCPRFLGNVDEVKLKETVQQARNWASKAVDELPNSPWVLPAVVRAVNLTAEFNLGFTEPFSRLDFKLQALVEESKDMQALGYTMLHLGERVPVNSPYAAIINRNFGQLLANPALLDWLILTKQQEIVILVKGAAQSDINVVRYLMVANALLPILCTPSPADDIYCQSKTQARASSQMSVKQLGAASTRALEIELLHQIKALTSYRSKMAQLNRSQLGGPDPVDLVPLLRNADPWVRWGAATFIGRKHVHAEKELIALLSDPVIEVREAAHQALVKLARGTDFGPSIHDAQPKIQQAIKRWEDWLALQDPSAPTVRQRRIDETWSPSSHDLQSPIVDRKQ